MGLWGRVALSGVVCALVAFVPSCDKKKEEQAPVAYTPPPPPPPDPMEGLKLDPRVQFPQERAPTTPELAQAVATLASALAKGDAPGAKSVLDAEARAIVDEMVEAGQWEAGTKGIEAVRVCILKEQAEASIATVGLGIQDARGAYLLAWRGSNVSGAWEFEPMPLDETEATQVALLDEAQLLSRTLPAPESVNVDPESRKKIIQKRFTRNDG